MAGLVRTVMRGRAVRRATAGALVVASTLTFVVATGGPAARAGVAPLVGPLAVSGTKLVDLGNGGVPVVLGGVNVLADGAGPYVGGIVDTSAVQTLQGWGANFVRLDISTDEIVQDCPSESYDRQYKTDLAQTVARLTAAGIYTVLDINEGDPNCSWNRPVPSGTAPLAGEDAVPALQYLAATYGSDPLVGFEPFNEPQACATATSGPGASVFVPAYGQRGDVCANETLADLAWANAGLAEGVSTLAFGIKTASTTYATPGMDTLFATVMQNVPAGRSPLLFMDANYFASDSATFDQLGQLASADNIVEVFHPYDCQDTSGGSNGNQNANCKEANPEACTTTSQNVHRYMVDRLSGQPQNRPVVFDELNFPGQEHVYQAPVGPAGMYLPIDPYQHGLWVNNTISAAQAQGGAGWAIYYFQNADVNNVVGPYSMIVPGITASTPTPWSVNVNDAPAVRAMEGQGLSCQAPPPGYDVAI